MCRGSSSHKTPRPQDLVSGTLYHERRVMVILPPKDRIKTIVLFALPIIGGMASQNVLNLVDTAMVGVLGSTALAAVGLGSFANYMAVAFITGLSAGVQAMAARRVGEGRSSETAVPLNGGLVLAIVLSVPLSLLLILNAGRLFPLLVKDPEVVALGVPYFQARLFAMVAIGMNFSFRGYWNGVGLSRVYLQTLLIMHASNIVLNYVLIFGRFGFPELGSTGAGIGTAISTYLGTAIYIMMALRHARRAGFLQGLPDRASLRTMLTLAVPAGLQQLFFATGMTAFFWIIGRVGTAELAASNVLVQLLLVVLLPGLGFGLTAASLVGQALGRGDPLDARRLGWQVSQVAAYLVGLLALGGFFFPRLILAIFLHDKATLELAVLPMRLVAATMAIDTVGTVLMNALLGAGDSRRVMILSIALQWGLFLPIAYLLGPVLGFGMTGVWSAQVFYRLLQTIAFTLLWRQGKWTSIRV